MNKMILLTKISFRNLWRNPWRTWLTIGGIALSSMGLILMHGFAEYSYFGLKKRFSNSGVGHIQVGSRDAFHSAIPENFRIDSTKTVKIVDEIRKMGAISSVKRKINGIIGNGERTEVFQGEAVNFPEFLTLSQSFHYEPDKFVVKEGDIVLGKVLSKRLQVQIGDSVSVLVSTDDGRTNAMDLTISALVETGSDQLDAVVVYLPFETAKNLYTSNKVDLLMFGLKNPNEVDEKLEQVNNTLSSNNPELSARSWLDIADYYHSVRGLYSRLIGTMQLVLGFIVILSISNSFVLVIQERRSELGTLRAIGIPPFEVLSMLALEGLLLGALGGFSGAIVAGGISGLTEILGGIPMPPPPGSSSGYSLYFYIDFVTCIKVVLFSIICAMMASLFAGRSVLKLSIPESISAVFLIFAVQFHAHAQDPSSSSTSILPSTGSISSVDKGLMNEGRMILQIWDELRGKPEKSYEVESKFENLDLNDKVSASVVYKVFVKPGQVLAVSTSDPAGSRLAILSQPNGMWMQKEGMRKPMRISPAQRLMGQASNGDIASVNWSSDYNILSFNKPILILESKPGSDAAYKRIELRWNYQKECADEVKFFALSGKLLKTATYQCILEDGERRLKSILIQDAINKNNLTRIILTKAVLSQLNSQLFNPERLDQIFHFIKK